MAKRLGGFVQLLVLGKTPLEKFTPGIRFPVLVSGLLMAPNATKLQPLDHFYVSSQNSFKIYK